MAPVARELSSNWGVLEPLQTADSLEGQVQELRIILEKNADLPNVPVALERAAGDEQRQVLRLLIAGQYVGRPFFTSPDIPADRKAALRAAFDATMKDPQFLADAAKLDLEISPVGAATIDAFLAELYRTPKDVVSKAVTAIQK